jgi:hypothetical protein
MNKYKITQQLNNTEIYEFIFSIIFLIGVTILSIIVNKNSPKAKKLIFNKYFILFFILIILFSYFILFIFFNNDTITDENLKIKKRIKIATKHAIIAYIIAIFTQLDSIIIAPFIVVWVVSYFLNVE